MVGSRYCTCSMYELRSRRVAIRKFKINTYIYTHTTILRAAVTAAAAETYSEGVLANRI